jgi:molecular chaperone DnaJ
MVRLSGAGEAVAGGSPGDLYVKLHVNPDPIFSKDKENLRMRLPLKLSDALLGSTQKIELLDGSAITVKTPPGVAHGEILRVRGKGVPIERNRRGDLLITIEITLPKRLSRKSKKLIEELKEEGI